jgi:glycosyltransferase involved in cell wall biosynthesis
MREERLTGGGERLRVLQSFPHKIGAARICTTAWHQAAGVAEAGGDVLAMPGAIHRPLPPGVRVRPTLARGPLRIPYKPLGRARALRLHDRIVAHALPKLAREIDVVHTWPMGARETLRTARRLGIPAVLERPNAHTRFAYEVVRAECERLGVALPAHHEHAYDADVLRLEEEEYELADRLLCPSDFVLQTFLDQGFARERLVRHSYGYDHTRFHPASEPRDSDRGLTLLFAGVCAVRKGLHFALEAWQKSPASENGRFLVAGEFLPEYAARLSSLLSHPTVEVLGHRTDVPELMRSSDALVLPSIEEGSALVCSEALASGCVPVVSDASGAVCEHGVNGLVHRVGDVGALAAHITSLHEDSRLLDRLRAACIRTAPDYTWTSAGRRLLEVYEELVAERAGRAIGRAA